MPFKFENNTWYYQPSFLKYHFIIPYWSRYREELRFKTRSCYLPELLKRYSGSWGQQLDIWPKIWHSYFMDVFYRQTDPELFKNHKFVKYLSEADLKDILSSLYWYRDEVARLENYMNKKYDSYDNNEDAYHNIEDIIKYHNRQIWKWYKLPGYVKPVKEPKTVRHEREDRLRFVNNTDIPFRRIGTITEKYMFPKPLESYQYYYGRYIVPGHKGHPGYHWHEDLSDYIY